MGLLKTVQELCTIQEYSRSNIIITIELLVDYQNYIVHNFLKTKYKICLIQGTYILVLLIYGLLVFTSGFYGLIPLVLTLCCNI